MRRGLRTLLIGGFALLFFSPAAIARDLTPEVRARLFAPTVDIALRGPTVRLPLTRTDSRGYYECPYLNVFVNGKGPFTFLYDTGAAYTVVSSRVVSAAAPHVVFDRAGERDVVQLAKVTVGGVSLGGVWAIHDDNNPGIDGILGAPAFGGANVLFDLAGRELLVSKSRIDLPGSFELPYRSAFNVPTVPMTIDGRTVEILIDTGDDAYGLELRPEELGDAALAHPPTAAGSVLNGTNVQPTKVTTLRDSIALGPVRADHAVVAVNADLPVGDLGYDVLRQFRFVIDPRARVVRFQPRFRGGRFVVPATFSAGFTVQFDGSGMVRDVATGSEAERAGLHPGDRLRSVNGIPAGSLTPKSWDRLLASRRDLRLRWSHSGATRTGRWRAQPVE